MGVCKLSWRGISEVLLGHGKGYNPLLCTANSLKLGCGTLFNA